MLVREGGSMKGNLEKHESENEHEYLNGQQRYTARSNVVTVWQVFAAEND